MTTEPLAYRMRPRHIDEIIGQQHIIGPNTGIYKMIKNGKVPSMLLYGEPGIGKTSIAYAISQTVNLPFEAINATTSGVKDIKEIVERAKKTKEETNQNTILFVDEIHRFDKKQQDALLPHAEKQLVILVGATTENPYHSVLPAIRSRCGQVKQLKRLTLDEIKSALKRALDDKERGLGEFNISIEEELLELIAVATNGEVRSSLNILEMAFYASDKNEDESVTILKETVEEFLENKGMNYDKNGDAHYDILSAFQKSIRGSDVDASLHYLARLIEAGDEKSIIRRLKVIAWEDIGIGNPIATVFTNIACDAVRELGFPEARIPLANAVVMLCLSEKSNSAYKALDMALADIRSGKVGEIPPHLKDSHYASAKKLGHGVDYLYPHNYPLGSFGGWVNQQYLPDLLKDRKYYEPIEAGNEARLGKIHKRLNELKEEK